MSTARHVALILASSIAVYSLGCSPVPNPSVTPSKNALDDAPPPDPESVKAMNQPPPVKNAETPDMDFLKDMSRRSMVQAQKCDSPENKGPREPATVDVTFEPIGRSGAIVVRPPHGGTPLGDCIKRAFEGVIVTGWKGEAVTIEQKIEFPKKAEPPPDPKKK